MASLLTCFVDPPGSTPDPAVRNLRTAMNHRVDVRGAFAAKRSVHPEAVLRRVVADPERTKARREFCETWPILSSTMLSDEVLRAVDTGARTIPVVADALGVSAAVARRLVGRPRMPSLMGLSRLIDPMSDLVERKTYPPSVLFGCIGHDRLPGPGDTEAWTDMCFVSSCMSSMLSRCDVETARLPVDEIVGTILGGGSSWAARAGAIRSAVETPTEFGDAADMVSALARWLTGLRIEADASLALRLVAMHGSLQRIHAASRRWHDAPELASFGVNPSAMSWPVPFDPVDLGDGWIAVALPDGASLRHEGLKGKDPSGMSGLAHCVGNYAPSCQTGDSLIVSLRRMNGDAMSRVSTLDLAPHEAGEVGIAGRTYRVVQHKAHRNAVPPAEAVARMRALLEMLSLDKVAVRPEALEIRPAVETRPLTRKEAMSLLPSWRRVLPERIATMEVDGIAGLVGEMGRGVPPTSSNGLAKAAGRMPH